MKSHKLIWALALLSVLQLRSQVGVNILTTHTSAALQVASPSGTYRGLLTPSMTAQNRINLSSSGTPADGLIVYDVNHKMHYYYNGGIFRWTSMSPWLLTTPTSSSSGVPTGAITTPSAFTTYSVGINTQSPSRELTVMGNEYVSGTSEVAGNFTLSGSMSKTGFPVNPFVPAGTIVMWHGNAIPAGWAECNGQNGTPDLRGKFIVAAGQAASTPVSGDNNPVYTVNTTGGENRHTLSKNEIPKHVHAVNGDGATVSANGGAHTHGVALIAGSTGVATGTAKSVVPTNGNSGNTNVVSHSHPNSEFSGQTGDGTSDALNNQPHENRPHYYVLRFIMKLN